MKRIVSFLFIVMLVMHYTSAQTHSGNKKGLVILVEFPDQKMSKDQKLMQRMFNEEGFSDGGNFGSVRDYFIDQSYGRLDINFDVIGPVLLSQKLAYYGEDVMIDGKRNDKRPCTLVAEAVKAIDKKVNFKDYDWNGDGKAEQVLIVFAGYGQNAGQEVPATALWAHEWTLSDGAKTGDGRGSLKLDGTVIDTYAMMPELRGSFGDKISGIGQACHEFCHCLGLPDFYSVNKGFGMCGWDIMDHGSYNGPSLNGECPAGFTAYEKEASGWLETEELNSPRKIRNMPSLGEEAIAFKIKNGNDNDYYLIENRKADDKWYAYANNYRNAGGLLVTHIQFDEKAWQSNEVNANEKLQRMTIIPASGIFGDYYEADGLYLPSEQQFQGHLYPGLTERTSIELGGKIISNIEVNNDSTVTFDVSLPNELKKTHGLEETSISASGFEANWNDVNTAEGYIMELTEVCTVYSASDRVLIGEDMKRCQADNDSTITDITDSLALYMNNEGWEGIMIYEGMKRMVVGSKELEGYLLSPVVDVSESDTILIVAGTEAFMGNETQIRIDVYTADGIYIGGYYPIKVNNPTYNFMVLPTTYLPDKKIRFRISSFEDYNPFSLFAFYCFSKNFTNQEALDCINGKEPDNHGQKYDGETILIENIVQSSLVLSNLKGQEYRYRVQAVNSLGFGPWSDWHFVTLTGGTTSIERIEINGELDTESTKSTMYNLQGLPVGNADEPGIYIKDRKLIYRAIQ